MVFSLPGRQFEKPWGGRERRAEQHCAGQHRAEAAENGGELFPDKMRRLTVQLVERFAEAARLEGAIRENMKGLGYGL